MRHFPKKLISFRKLQGGQFGTLDVAALSPDYIQLALGTDFVQLTRPQWIALRSMADRFFASETERVVLTREDGEPVVFEDLTPDAIDLEEIYDQDAAAPPPRHRARRVGRRRDLAG